MKGGTRPIGERAATRLGLCALLAGAMLAAGCAGDRLQSMLHPQGPGAERIAELWWVMFVVYSAVFVLTMLTLVMALRAGRQDRPVLGNRFIAVSGIVIPLLILVVMLLYTVRVTASLSPRETDMTIEVVGHQWWWEVHYPEQGIVTANELHIPAGASVQINLRAADVVHSFWVPELNGKMDALPEHTNTTWIQAEQPGVYRGQCAEYCGTQHARMGFHVVAMPAEAFEQWVDDRVQAATETTETQHDDGQEVFLSAGCGACHGIRNVSIATDAGPDLTHIASRLSIGAATQQNTRENLRAWIVNPHSAKPGNAMPPTHIDPDDLDALVAYLMSLE